MAIKIQLRRGTAAEWTSANPVLMQGEMGVETDTLKVKIGNGSTAWATLPYFTQGAKGDKGDQGIQGIQGVIGNTGPTGPVGPPNSLTVGTVTSGIEGSDAEVTITGTSPNQVMNLVIPRGDKGDAATIAVGTVTSVAAGQPVTVTNSGTSAAAVLNFEIPNAIGVPTGGVEGQIVRKTATATEWADMPPSQLSAQTDVTITSPQAKQVLKYDGAEWVNATASGGVTVSETSPADPSQGDGWFFAADGTQFVRYDDGTSVQWVQPNAPLAAQVEQRYYSPNYIINGGMDIWQRGTSNTGSADTYGPDRWRTYGYATNSATISQQTFAPGTAPVAGYEATYFCRAVSSNTRMWLFHAVEDVRTLAGQTATFSFWAKSAASQNVTLDFAQVFGAGGSDPVVSSPYSFAVTTSWQRFTVTHVFPSIAGKTIGANNSLHITFRGGINNAFDLWGVQLEQGSTATAFRRNANSIQGELAACQRYLEYGSSKMYMNATGSYAVLSVNYKVTKRATPTITTWGAGARGYVPTGIEWNEVDGFCGARNDRTEIAYSWKSECEL